MDALDRIAEQWKSEKPNLNTKPMILLGRLLKVSKYMETEQAKLHKIYGLKPGEFDVLASLLRNGTPYQLKPSELISSMMLTSGAMTNRLDKLEQKGMIARTHSQSDRRSIKVKLTKEGLALIGTLMPLHVELQVHFIDNLKDEEIEQCSDILASLLTKFE